MDISLHLFFIWLFITFIMTCALYKP